jgi:hypothetical protein
MGPGRRDLVAAVVNETLAPAVLVAGQLLLVGWHAGQRAGVSRWWGLPAALFAVAIPMAYVVHGVRRGRFTNHHIPEREHRPLPMLIAIAAIIAGLLLLNLLGAPRDIVALLGAGTAGLVVFAVVTRWWKISFHAGVAGGTALVLTCVYGPVGLLVVPFVVVVCWARHRVRAHTVAQVCVGAVLGATIAGIVFPNLR